MARKNKAILRDLYRVAGTKNAEALAPKLGLHAGTVRRWQKTGVPASKVSKVRDFINPGVTNNLKKVATEVTTTTFDTGLTTNLKEVGELPMLMDMDLITAVLEVDYLTPGKKVAIVREILA